MREHIVRKQLTSRKVTFDETQFPGDGYRVLPAVLALPTGSVRLLVITLEIRKGAVKHLDFARRIALRDRLVHGRDSCCGILRRVAQSARRRLEETFHERRVFGDQV